DGQSRKRARLGDKKEALNCTNPQKLDREPALIAAVPRSSSQLLLVGEAASLRIHTERRSEAASPTRHGSYYLAGKVTSALFPARTVTYWVWSCSCPLASQRTCT